MAVTRCSSQAQKPEPTTDHGAVISVSSSEL